MKKNIRRIVLSMFAIILITVLFVGCDSDIAQNDPPEVTATSPSKGATDAAINGSITATFKQSMDPATITNSTFTISKDGASVAGTVTYDVANKRAVFAPSAILSNSKVYVATVTTGVKTTSSIAMTENKVWSFTTDPAGTGPSPVLLGTAGNYVILAKTAISTVPSSVITGDIGISPAAESYMTGFSQTDATGYATSPQVTGFLFAADMAPPTNTNLTTAVENMITAYNDAAGRITPDHSEYGASGEIGGNTLAPGLYTWTTDVTIGSDVTINGGANDTWIFQITGDLNLDSAKQIILSGGAQAKNIVWQVSGKVVMGANSHFEGIVLCLTEITMNTSASINGRLLAQTQVALAQATVTNPAQ